MLFSWTSPMMSGNVDGLGELGDLLERALNTVVDATHAARPKLQRKWLARAGDGVAHGQTGGLLVHLDGGAVLLKTDDLAHKAVVADAHKLVHRRAKHIIGDDDGAGDGVHTTDARHGCLFCARDGVPGRVSASVGGVGSNQATARARAPLGARRDAEGKH